MEKKRRNICSVVFCCLSLSHLSGLHRIVRILEHEPGRRETAAEWRSWILRGKSLMVPSGRLKWRGYFPSSVALFYPSGSLTVPLFWDNRIILKRESLHDFRHFRKSFWRFLPQKLRLWTVWKTQHMTWRVSGFPPNQTCRFHDFLVVFELLERLVFDLEFFQLVYTPEN